MIDRAETEARVKYLQDVLNETKAAESNERKLHLALEATTEKKPTKLGDTQNQIEFLSGELDRVKYLQENIEPLQVALPDEAEDTVQPTSPTGANPSGANSNSDKNGK